MGVLPHQLGTLLVLADLGQGLCAWTVAPGFLDPTLGRAAACHLLVRGLPTRKGVFEDGSFPCRGLGPRHGDLKKTEKFTGGDGG